MNLAVVYPQDRGGIGALSLTSTRSQIPILGHTPALP